MAEIRPALPADAPGMARVHVLSWQHAYKGLLPQPMLDQLSIETRTKQWAQWLENGNQLNLVAEADEGIVGFASGGPLRGDFAGFDAEIAAIYLLPGVQGQGLGRSLFTALQELLAAEGHRRMLVWVLESNAPARAFYERLGGRPCLTQTAVLGSSEQPIEVAEVGYGFDLKQL